MNIFHLISSIFKRSQAESDPMRDWLMVLTFAAVALAGIVVWNMWAFDTIARGGSIGSVATSSPPVFNKSSLNIIHTVFEDRATEEARYRTGVYRYADPSQ